jgi:hypothetical protein
MSTTRRAFVQGVAAAGVVAAVGPLAADELPSQPAPEENRAPERCTPVVAFFMDQPYLDWSGQAEPYVPPAGLRSAIYEGSEVPFRYC